MRNGFGLMLLALSALSIAGCGSVPTLDFNHEQVMRYDGKPLSMADMDRAIRIAVFREGWQTDSVTTGHIVATKHPDDNSWSETVDILYTTTEFSIDYKNSHGLDYNPQTHSIARHGRGIVEDLKERIDDTVQDIILENQQG